MYFFKKEKKPKHFSFERKMEKADKKSGKRLGGGHLGESLGCTHAQAL